VRAQTLRNTEPGPDAKSLTAKKFGFLNPDDGGADLFIQPGLLRE
jgi:hypothetical protein